MVVDVAATRQGWVWQISDCKYIWKHFSLFLFSHLKNLLLFLEVMLLAVAQKLSFSQHSSHFNIVLQDKWVISRCILIECSFLLLSLIDKLILLSENFAESHILLKLKKMHQTYKFFQKVKVAYLCFIKLYFMSIDTIWCLWYTSILLLPVMSFLLSAVKLSPT